jgi:hypothetical protein
MLAAFGADVLHVRGPSVPVVPAFVVDTGHGKRQAHADFTDADQLAALRDLALAADVVVQGYRPGVVASTRTRCAATDSVVCSHRCRHSDTRVHGRNAPAGNNSRNPRAGCVSTRSATRSR